MLFLSAYRRTHTPASEDFGQEHAVDSFRWAFGEVVRVDSFAGKVGSLAKHRGVFATDSGVEVVLADALHHVGRGAVEEVTLAHLPVPLWQAPGHVLLLPVEAEQQFIYLRKEYNQCIDEQTNLKPTLCVTSSLFTLKMP